MKATIQRDVVRRLIRDFEFKEKDKYLQQGVCPACHKRELFTSIEKPWMLKCGRENKCGKEILVKELYRDIFEDWSKRYQPTPEAPNATAEAYLREARGLDTSKLAGCYTQGTFIKNNLGSATVKFKLANGSGWERIIDQPDRFNQKANLLVITLATGGSIPVWICPNRKRSGSPKVFLMPSRLMRPAGQQWPLSAALIIQRRCSICWLKYLATSHAHG